MHTRPLLFAFSLCDQTLVSSWPALVVELASFFLYLNNT